MGLDQSLFAVRLRNARAASRLTGEGLAKLAGVQRTAIVNLESGSRRPSVDTLFDIAKALGVSVDYLMGLDDRPPETAPEPPPKWVADLMPDLETLPPAGREAVRALVKGVKK